MRGRKNYIEVFPELSHGAGSSSVLYSLRSFQTARRAFSNSGVRPNIIVYFSFEKVTFFIFYNIIE